MYYTMNFKELAERNISEWSPSFPIDHPRLMGRTAISLFYLGDFDQAQQISRMYSDYKYKLYKEGKPPLAHFDKDKIKHLFDAALYASLANDHAKANTFWQELIDQRSRLFPGDQVTEYRTAEAWLYEAYALVRLGQYDQAEKSTLIGLQGVLAGNGISTEAHVYKPSELLADLILKLAQYKKQPNSEYKDMLQEALQNCHEDGAQSIRSHYEVIFDLQFSYPDDIVPVLPSENPDDD